MRYVLLLLTILTAGLSIWYYQTRISPEGKELNARKTAMKQASGTLQKKVNQIRKELDKAQDAAEEGELAVEKFREAYLEKKREQEQKAEEEAYRKDMAEQKEEVDEHNQKLLQLRKRMTAQKANSKSARENLLQEKERLNTLLRKLNDKQRSIQAELTNTEHEAAQKQEEAKTRKKFSGSAARKGNLTELRAQLNGIQKAIAGMHEKIRRADTALAAHEEKAGKQEQRMRKTEEKLAEQKNRALADEEEEEETPVTATADEDLLAAPEYREQSRTVREALAKAREKEKQVFRTYDQMRSELNKASREEAKGLEKEEKDHASFRKLFTAGASVAGFLLLLFTVGAFRRNNG